MGMLLQEQQRFTAFIHVSYEFTTGISIIVLLFYIVSQWSLFSERLAFSQEVLQRKGEAEN